MRFLLHPPVRSLAKSTKSIVKSSPSTSSSLGTSNNTTLNAKSNHKNNSNSKTDGEIYKTFGQQCSPNCGCAIRFEATYDPNDTNNRIISMSYDAKTLVSTMHHSEENGSRTLVPVYTASTPSSMRSGRNNNKHGHSVGRPMLKECKCETVHSLAQRIIESMSSMTLTQAQNQLEFVGVRSSPAFRYTVLKNHGLLKMDQGNRTTMNSHTKMNTMSKRSVEETIFDTSEGHCFDLVEDALIACLKGYMPQPRRHNTTRLKGDMPIKSPRHFMEEKSRDDNGGSGGDHLDPLRFVNAAKRRTAGLFYKSAAASSTSGISNGNGNGNGSENSVSSLPSAMPPFHLMGNPSNDNPSHDTLSELRMEIKSLQEDDKRKDERDNIEMLNSNDWLSYVDERNCE